jgi:hypothetical protein
LPLLLKVDFPHVVNPDPVLLSTPKKQAGRSISGNDNDPLWERGLPAIQATRCLSNRVIVHRGQATPKISSSFRQSPAPLPHLVARQLGKRRLGILDRKGPANCGLKRPSANSGHTCWLRSLNRSALN